jgi:hypothetical protein
MENASYNYDMMSVQQLADLRVWQLQRLEAVSDALRARLREEYRPGDNINQLARKLGVTRRTIYLWLK